ncbi:MAG: hypothetical protein ACIAS6_00715, partial [Phycisphaerales bacterium JB060]
SLLKFFDGGLTNALGGAFLLAGAATACLGFYRAVRTRRAINRVMRAASSGRPAGNSGGGAGQPPR